jgi:DNA-binding NtrC family response regulator
MATYHVLLVERFPDLRDVLRDLMDDAGWIVDVVMTTYEMRLAIAQTDYDCVFLNLDQGRLLNFGLELADYAAARGARIIMILDHEIEPAATASKGWLQLTKPFTVADLQAVLAQALGLSSEATAIQQRADDHEAGKD